MTEILKKGVGMALLGILISQMALATDISPTTFPVFLKEGFSSILEFEEAPSQVVLGDQNLFQVEKLGRSIVLKPLTAYATTNMFVYFKNKDTKLFILTASEEAEPTYYKKFSDLKPPEPAKPLTAVPKRKFAREVRLTKSDFDKKKDFLTIDLEISADSAGKLAPSWDLIRLKYKDHTLSPSKLWSERREVQRDSSMKARLIFMKPNVPADLKDTSVIVPIKGGAKALVLNLKRVAR